MDIPFDNLLNDVLQDDALEHISHVDDLAHVASADDSTGIYRKDLPERILAANALENGLNGDISKGVPSIGIFYKDVSDNVKHYAAADRGASVQLITLERDASLQTGMSLGRLFFLSCLPFFAKIILAFHDVNNQTP